MIMVSMARPGQVLAKVSLLAGLAALGLLGLAGGSLGGGGLAGLHLRGLLHLALLHLTEGGLAGSLAELGLLVALLADLLQGGTHDGTLELGGLAGALPLHILSQTLLVHAAPGAGPLQLSGLLALQEHAHALGVDDVVGRAILAAVLAAVAGVHTVFAERARFGLDHHCLA